MHPSGVAAAQAVVDVLTAAGLNARYAENVLYSIYKKVCVNATLNGLCTILDSNIAGFGKTTVAESIIENIVGEIVAVAANEEVQLNLEEILSNIRSTFDPNGIGAHFPSMYQDLIKNNRLTEIDYINGSIAKKGAKYGVATPYNAFLTELVHCKEEILGAK
jgi:2-dehydropantoate 2-reductase